MLRLDTVTDFFNKMVSSVILHTRALRSPADTVCRSCYSKCISTRFAEPDLNKGESVCNRSLCRQIQRGAEEGRRESCKAEAQPTPLPELLVDSVPYRHRIGPHYNSSTSHTCVIPTTPSIIGRQYKSTTTAHSGRHNRCDKLGSYLRTLHPSLHIIQYPLLEIGEAVSDCLAVLVLRMLLKAVN